MHFGQQGECLLQLQQAWDSACWQKKSVRQDLTMPHCGRPARLERTSLRVCACDAAIAYALVHPGLFILIRDSLGFLDSCRPLSGMKRITAGKNAMPVQW